MERISREGKFTGSSAATWDGYTLYIAFDPINKWFCTCSADCTTKIWDVGVGTLELTLTGHIEQIRGLAVSSRHNIPIFSLLVMTNELNAGTLSRTRKEKKKKKSH